MPIHRICCLGELRRLVLRAVVVVVTTAIRDIEPVCCCVIDASLSEEPTNMGSVLRRGEQQPVSVE